MDTETRNITLTNAEIRAIIDDTERQALGGAGGAIARAGLGTMAIVLAVFASTNAQTVGLILLSGLFLLGLAVYIRTVARSVSMKPRVPARAARRRPAPSAESLETTAVTTPSPQTDAQTPAIPTPAVSAIPGGAWSRPSQKQTA